MIQIKFDDKNRTQFEDQNKILFYVFFLVMRVRWRQAQLDLNIMLNQSVMMDEIG